MNQQLELKFFWPLTEQTILELDFAPCLKYENDKREQQIKNSLVTGIVLNAGTGITNTGATWAVVDPSYQNFQVLPDGAVGSWQVTPNMSVGRKTKPKLLHRLFTKFILGWEWKDK